jgi:hypothetical protein
MVKFTETKTEDLIKRIENLKAERERTADCLARLEAELERRKQLGVPCEGRFYVNLNGNVSETLSKRVDLMFNSFHSEESAEKHAEMLLAWRKALVANAKGEQLDIEVLLPLLKKGWVAMDEDGSWIWYENKPYKRLDDWSTKGSIIMELYAFNIKRADDWKTSLMECGL